MTTAALTRESTAVNETLFVSFELSQKQWRLTCTRNLRAPRWRRTVRAWAFNEVVAALGTAKRALGLAAESPARSCYEAGREAFALHRFLTAQGVTNVVIDPASLRVDRRMRRVKTDRVDGDGLLTALLHATAGDRDALRVARVPSEAQEDGGSRPASSRR